MSILGRLLGIKPTPAEIASDLQGQAHRTEAVVQRIMKEGAKQDGDPFACLGLTLIRAAHACTVANRTRIPATDKTSRRQQEVSTFLEYVYFFSHLATRSDTNELPSAKLQRIAGFVSPLLFWAATDSYFAHANWPKELLASAKSGFAENMASRANEYGNLSLAGEKGAVFSGSAFALLAQRVATCMGDDRNPITIFLAKQCAMEAYLHMNLRELLMAADAYAEEQMRA